MQAWENATVPSSAYGISVGVITEVAATWACRAKRSTMTATSSACRSDNAEKGLENGPSSTLV